jgi:hypothetical protein
MNKHIKRLAEQATRVFEPNDPDYRYETFDKNKFAELIVQECLDIIAPYLLKDEAQYRDPGRPRQHPILEIKDHFGIK